MSGYFSCPGDSPNTAKSVTVYHQHMETRYAEGDVILYRCYTGVVYYKRGYVCNCKYR